MQGKDKVLDITVNAMKYAEQQTTVTVVPTAARGGMC